jgi:DNA-binding NtrC family response regulator
MKSKGKVFLLDDDELIVSVLLKALEKEGYELHAETTTDGVVNKIKSWDPDIVLLDITMPGRDGINILNHIKNTDLDAQVVMLTADDTAETAVRAMKLGAADYLTKPFNIDEVKIVINNVLEKESLKQEVTYLRKAYSEVVEKDLIGESSPIKEMKEKINKMAQAGVSTILITGESGAGKEVVARHIHNLMFGTGHSFRSPFVSINCAAMPETLLESELFGHEKGSFTDAKTSKKGLFEQAKGGTILLDEIGDMKLDLQTKLLRVLEERTIRRVGGKWEIPIELTAIATSNRNLSEAVKSGAFRRDLFFRLSTFYLHMLPLRERKEDIPLLARHFLLYFAKQYNRKKIRGFSPEAEQLLIDSSWPGNVRELKNLVERLVVLEDTEYIIPEHLPKFIFDQTISTTGVAKTTEGASGFRLPEQGASLAEVERKLIEQALEKTGGNQVRAAKLLDITRDALRHRMKKYGLL